MIEIEQEKWDKLMNCLTQSREVLTSVYGGDNFMNDDGEVDPDRFHEINGHIVGAVQDIDTCLELK